MAAPLVSDRRGSSRGPAHTPAAPLVRLHGIGKRFGELWAVRDVDLELQPGCIHALLGENGAGKTTLMCMLGGLYRPDAGWLELDGARLALRSPREAAAAGVGMVHQHFSLVPSLSVAENVMLGALPRLIRSARLRREVAEAAERLGLHVDPAAPVGALSVGEQQRVEILRVLKRGARLLILDEPTAVLAPGEVDSLLASLRRLAGEGCAVVLVSHKLEELRRVADRISIMRGGRLVAQVDDPAARSAEELAAAMVGREVSLHLERTAQASGPARLVARGLRALSDRGLEAVRGVDLRLCAGEIVGLAGVSGNGQGELLEALAGLRPLRHGELCIDDEDVSRAAPRRRAALGLRYIPEDRHTTGTAPSLSLRENLQLRSYRVPPARRGLWLDLHADDDECRRRVESLQIAAASLDQSARLLSGGNLQKLVVARELDEGARIVLCLHPTRGLDAWATAEVRRRLLAARARGCAVLLCSEDLDEVLALSDRVVVMRDGQLVHEAAADGADRLGIGRHMLGHREARA
jgi:general nucleoside transport system ATP-binding protein